MTGGRHSLSTRAHVHRRMSLYAVRLRPLDAYHQRRFDVRTYSLLKVMGAHNVDGKSTPCARCGGMVETTVEMMADYARRDGSDE